MPVVAGVELRGNPRYPKISRWYSAMDSRPAYQKVKSDDTTLNLVIRCAYCAQLLALSNIMLRDTTVPTNLNDNTTSGLQQAFQSPRRYSATQTYLYAG